MPIDKLIHQEAYPSGKFPPSASVVVQEAWKLQPAGFVHEIDGVTLLFHSTSLTQPQHISTHTHTPIKKKEKEQKEHTSYGSTKVVENRYRIQMVPCIARMPSLCGLKHQMSHGPDKRRPRGTCGLKVVCKSEDDGSDQKNRRGTNQSRRLSVLGLWATIPLLNGLGQEARMWRDEMEYYRRKMTNAIDKTVFADPTASSKPKPNQKVAKKLDAKFAATLIESMDSAAGDSKEEYRTVCDQLRRREIVEFQKAGTCGHCGSQRGLAAYSDRDYFDFETYIRGKALLQMAPRVSENEADKEEYVRKIQLSMGSSIYRYILRDVDIEGAAAVGIAPGGAVSRDNLLSASPDLDSIRKGVAAILEYFRQKGTAFMYVKCVFRPVGIVVVGTAGGA